AEQRARGIDARVGDVQDLPFDEGEFDVAVAAWMLYHVPDLDRGLAELARVLKPEGVLVAVTNSVEHLQELWTLAERASAIASSGFAATTARRSCIGTSRQSGGATQGGSWSWTTGRSAASPRAGGRSARSFACRRSASRCGSGATALSSWPGSTIKPREELRRVARGLPGLLRVEGAHV